MTGFDVDADVLRDHARHLEAVSELVDEAVSAAATVSANDAAFGMLVGPVIAPWVNQVEEGGTYAVRGAAACVRTTVQGVRDMATVYEVVDDLVSTLMQRVGAWRG